MRREQFKLVSAILLLSGFSTGYMQAAPHAAATGVSIVQQDNTCKGVVLDQNGESVIGASVVVKGRRLPLRAWPICCKVKLPV